MMYSSYEPSERNRCPILDIGENGSAMHARNIVVGDPHVDVRRMRL